MKNLPELARKYFRYCDHTLPIQNTKPVPTPKYTPEIDPKSPSKTEIQKKKNRKYTKLGDFRIFFVLFLYFGFGGGIWGVFRGVFWGSGRFCVLYGERMITIQVVSGMPECLGKQFSTRLTFFVFWETFDFGNYYRQLYSMIVLGDQLL